MIKPYDLGEIIENTRSVNIDQLVRKAKKKFKAEFIKSSLKVNGVDIKLTTSKTRFGGKRFWFLCPICQKKRGVIYEKTSWAGCRICFGLKYKQQRFKGMIENTL